MTTIFIAGSRNIKMLNNDIKSTIDNIISQNFNIVIGDANGADKAVQKYLKELDYQNITIYYSGLKCRNNLGLWKVNSVFVDTCLVGRDFYTQKDIKMATVADFGFMIWDNNSKGTLNNILELTKQQKKVKVYSCPKRTFFKIKSPEHAKKLACNI